MKKNNKIAESEINIFVYNLKILRNFGSRFFFMWRNKQYHDGDCLAEFPLICLQFSFTCDIISMFYRIMARLIGIILNNTLQYFKYIS